MCTVLFLQPVGFRGELSWLTWPGLRHRALAAVILVAALGVMAPSGAFAHTPSDGVAHYPQNFAEKYDWGVGATQAWFQIAFDTAAQTRWMSGNNSATVTFDLNTLLNANFIEYRPRIGSGCDVGKIWWACIEYDGLGRIGRIVFNSTTTDVEYCENGSPSGCHYLKTLALHELGHAAALECDLDGFDHSQQGMADTVMMLAPPAGFDATKLGRCDIMKLQVLFDTAITGGAYAECGDHIPGAGTVNVGIKTVVTQSAPSATSKCIFQNVTFSGTAKLILDADLGLISANPLYSRTLTLQRTLIGTTNWANVQATTVATSGSWSTAATSTIGGTYVYRARFAGETGLAAHNSNTITVQWTTVGCPQ